MFNYARENFGYICPDRRFKNPVEGVGKITENLREITWLKVEEIEEQLNSLNNYPVIRAIVAVYIYAGLRREEALWLTHKDVNLSKRLIHIHAKKIDGEFWQPKTKTNRVVPISNALLEILNEYRLSTKCPWFFPSPQGKRWVPDNLSRKLRKINKKHELKWTCLDYRHTFGSLLAQKGESLYKISKLMGNSPEICRRHYAALIPERMKETVEFDIPANTDNNKNNENMEAMLKQILDKLEGGGGHKPPIRLVR